MIAALPPGPPPGPPPAAASAPVQPEDLAFELGRAHALRQLCFGREDAVWRERMSELLKAERADSARRQRLVLRFNAGFGETHAAFPACGPAAEAALKESAARGAKLAHALASAPRR